MYRILSTGYRTAGCDPDAARPSTRVEQHKVGNWETHPLHQVRADKTTHRPSLTHATFLLFHSISEIAPSRSRAPNPRVPGSRSASAELPLFLPGLRRSTVGSASPARRAQATAQSASAAAVAAAGATCIPKHTSLLSSSPSASSRSAMGKCERLRDENAECALPLWPAQASPATAQIARLTAGVRVPNHSVSCSGSLPVRADSPRTHAHTLAHSRICCSASSSPPLPSEAYAPMLSFTCPLSIVPSLISLPLPPAPAPASCLSSLHYGSSARSQLRLRRYGRHLPSAHCEFLDLSFLVWPISRFNSHWLLDNCTCSVIRLRRRWNVGQLQPAPSAAVELRVPSQLNDFGKPNSIGKLFLRFFVPLSHFLPLLSSLGCSKLFDSAQHASSSLPAVWDRGSI